MKRFLFWLARIFNVDCTVEKIVYRDKIVEVPTTVEKQIALEGVIDGEVTVKGNLYVIGHIFVAGNISAHGDVVYGMSEMEVRMKADKEVSAYKTKEV